MGRGVPPDGWTPGLPLSLRGDEGLVSSDAAWLLVPCVVDDVVCPPVVICGVVTAPTPVVCPALDGDAVVFSGSP